MSSEEGRDVARLEDLSPPARFLAERYGQGPNGEITLGERQVRDLLADEASRVEFIYNVRRPEVGELEREEIVERVRRVEDRLRRRAREAEADAEGVDRYSGRIFTGAAGGGLLAAVTGSVAVDPTASTALVVLGVAGLVHTARRRRVHKRLESANFEVADATGRLANDLARTPDGQGGRQ